jgi:AcrR family transcriptional regulator
MAMDNRSNLLAAALQLFAAKGYQAVGVQEIVEACAVTKPTLYHYFHSKQGLLEALLQEDFAPLSAALCEACMYQGDLPITLQRVAAASFEFASRHPDFYRLLLSLWFAPPQSDEFSIVAKHFHRQFGLLQEMFRLASRDHGNMRGRQAQYAASFQGIINTYIMLALNNTIQLDQDLTQKVVHQFSHGIYS